MTCLGRRIFYTLQNPNQHLRQLVKNVSNATNGTPQFYKTGPLNYNIYGCQAKRYSHCRRVDPCVKKKQEEKEKERKAKEKPKSFWASLFEQKRKPKYETCRMLAQKRQWEEEPIPEFIKDMCEDLPHGAAIYRTKGHAFILEVPCKKPKKQKISRSDVLLSKLERDKQCIDLEDEKNPMPCYTNPGKFFLELQSRKLHPLYKKLEMPRSRSITPFKLESKYCISVQSETKKRKMYKKLMYQRKKACFADFKMGVLPRYLEVKEKEYQINKNCILDKRKEKFNPCDFRHSPITQCPKIDCPRWLNQKPRK